MLDETKKLFNDDILSEALARFGSSMDTCEKLGGFEAYVFELTRPDGTYILKITHTNRRTPAYIMGELEFVNYLAARGIPTSLAVRSESGKYVEIIPDNKDGQFLAYCFEKAEGRLTQREDWTESFVQQWGATTAIMHRLAREYEPSRASYRRQQWDEDSIYTFAHALPPDKKGTFENAQAVIEKIRSQPKSVSTYGLIHGDLHQGNLFIDPEGVLRPFDFDDCEYHYFVSDIAIPLYYTAPGAKENNGLTRREFGGYFLTNFLKGYTAEGKVSRYWLELIPDFLLLRTVIMLSIFYQTTFDDELENKKGEYLAQFHNRLDNKIPVMDIAYEKIAREFGTE